MHAGEVWRRVCAGAQTIARGDRWGVALAARRGRLPHTLMARPGGRSCGAVLTRCSARGTWLA